jgi:hypothetical protein
VWGNGHQDSLDPFRDLVLFPTMKPKSAAWSRAV